MAVVFQDGRRTPSWMFMGTSTDGLRKRRSGSTLSMESVSDDDKCQLNDSLCDSGFQDASTASECPEALTEDHETEVPKRETEVPKCETVVSKREIPKRSSDFLSCVLPLAAMLVVFAALGFGLVMMMNKEAAHVDHQLNLKYKSMQFAREKISTRAGKDDVLDRNMLSDYPENAKFGSNSEGFDCTENELDNYDADYVNADKNQDGMMDYPDDPQFRSSYD